jgi:hypothetical protein
MDLDAVQAAEALGPEAAVRRDDMDLVPLLEAAG